MHFSKLSKEQGIVYVPILIAAIALIGFIFVSASADFKSNLFARLFPSKPKSHASEVSKIELIGNLGVGVTSLTQTYTNNIQAKLTYIPPVPSPTPFATASASASSCPQGFYWNGDSCQQTTNPIPASSVPSSITPSPVPSVTPSQAANPVITNITPVSGSIGTEITITGTNFGLVPGQLAFCCAQPGADVIWSDTQIKAKVPRYARTGVLTVIVGTGLNQKFARSQAPFTVIQTTTTPALTTTPEIGSTAPIGVGGSVQGVAYTQTPILPSEYKVAVGNSQNEAQSAFNSAPSVPFNISEWQAPASNDAGYKRIVNIQLTTNYGQKYAALQFKVNGSWQQALISAPINFMQAPTPTPPSTAVKTYSPKVMLLIFNPILKTKDNQRLVQYTKWNNPDNLTQDLIADIKQASGGMVNYSVAVRQEVDSFNVKNNGFVMTEEHYLSKCTAGAPDSNCNALANYNKILTDYQVCEKRNSGEIDELWMFGGPWFGYFESNLAGPKAFYYNSGPTLGTTCQKLLPIMGFNYERGVDSMFEDFGHRTESTMLRVFGVWSAGYGRTSVTPQHDWDKFSLLDSQNPGKGACGNAHTAVNSPLTSGDYDWSSSRTVKSSCADFANYPNLTGATQEVSCQAWGCTEGGYYKDFFYKYFPKAAGSINGKLNNWWAYLVDSENTIANPTSTSTPTPSPTPRASASPVPSLSPRPSAGPCPAGSVCVGLTPPAGSKTPQGSAQIRIESQGKGYKLTGNLSNLGVNKQYRVQLCKDGGKNCAGSGQMQLRTDQRGNASLPTAGASIGFNSNDNASFYNIAMVTDASFAFNGCNTSNPCLRGEFSGITSNIPGTDLLCKADVNGDGFISIRDISSLTLCSGKKGTDMGSHNVVCSYADLNNDGIVNEKDVNDIIKPNFGKKVDRKACKNWELLTPTTSPTPTPVPTPISVKIPDTDALCKADINSDGFINVRDFSSLTVCVGEKVKTEARAKYACKYADLNGDGQVNEKDVDDVIKPNFGKTVDRKVCKNWTLWQALRVDVNGDGGVGSVDALFVKRYVSNLDKILGRNIGDVNNDGKITHDDAELALKIGSNLNDPKTNKPFTADQKKRADVDRNGSVTSIDSLKIDRFAQGTDKVLADIGDIDMDGKLTNTDADLILRFAINLPPQ